MKDERSSQSRLTRKFCHSILILLNFNLIFFIWKTIIIELRKFSTFEDMPIDSVMYALEMRPTWLRLDSTCSCLGGFYDLSVGTAGWLSGLMAGTWLRSSPLRGERVKSARARGSRARRGRLDSAPQPSAILEGGKKKSATAALLFGSAVEWKWLVLVQVHVFVLVLSLDTL